MRKLVRGDGRESRAQQAVMEVPLERVPPESGARDGRLPVGGCVKDPRK